MILELLLATLPIIVVLVVSEILWRQGVVRGERARKFVHILAGCWVAFWPWLVSFDVIAIIGILAIWVQLIDRRLKIFHSTIDVPRRSVGDLLFPAGVAMTALLVNNYWIFAVVVLHLALADGLAAVVGQQLGESNTYSILGSKKSIAGTLTFLFISYALMGVLIAALHIADPWSLVIVACLPPVLAATENMVPFGLDNLAVPLLAATILQLLV